MVATASLVAFVEWRLIPAALEIVDYAGWYAEGQVRAGWSLAEANGLLARTVLANFGPLLALATLPALVGWLVLRKVSTVGSQL